MASAHIDISRTATEFSGEFSSFVDLLWRVCQDSARIKEIMDQIALGGDYTSLGVALSVSATDAETIYTLMGSVNTSLNVSPDNAFIAQMRSRLG